MFNLIMIIDLFLHGNFFHFYLSNSRDEILMVLRIVFYKLTNKNLPIYGVKVKNLKEYTTSKKDRKRNISRIPNELLRIDH